MCFRYGEKYGAGHQCKAKQLNLIMGEDDEKELSFEDAIGEQEEGTGNPGQVLDIPLNTLSGSLKKKQ